MYLHYNLWITNQLFQLVNIQKIHTYSRVAMQHISHSHWEALLYIHKSHEAGNRWVHVCWKYIKKVEYLYSDCIFFTDSIQCYGHVSAYFILSNTCYSLSQIAYLLVISTNSYLLLDPNVTSDRPLVRPKFLNSNIAWY